MNNVIIKEFDNIKIIILSLLGENHKNHGVCNQDSYSYISDSFGNFAIVLADGVSSCKNAKYGSQKACEAICKLLPYCNKLNEDEIKQHIFTEWKNLVTENWDDYGTTLNFIFFYSNKRIIGKVGDGAILLKIKDNFNFLADESEFYTSETFALGTRLPKYAFKVNFIQCETGSESFAIIMTDGIYKELDIDKLRQFSDYVHFNVDNPNFVVELENWVNDLNNGDDKTIMICRFKGR